MKDRVHNQLVIHQDKAKEWFEKQGKGLPFPLYTSFDLRDSGRKIAPVDANVFPAGFNNICAVDKENAADLVKEYLDLHYPNSSDKILLVTEEHTKNSYYWENVYTLVNLIEETGRRTKVTFPRELDESIQVKSISGQKLVISPNKKEGSSILIDGDTTNLIISNNDFSESKETWVNGLETPINPPYEMGWHIRRKDQFFNLYNELATDFAKIIDVDPWIFTIKTENFPEFDINSEECREALAIRVEEFIADLKAQGEAHGATGDPFVFVKNSAGTYGLAVIQVKSGDDVRNWTYKARKKMKATKGGGGVTQLVIQEGVATEVMSDGVSAEPAIYMVGNRLAGGFLRAHAKKGPQDSLNSPGAVFKRLCLSDLNISIEGYPLENVYGWVAKLGVLAVAKEVHHRKIEFKGYQI